MKKISPFTIALILMVSSLLSSCDLLTEVPNTNMSVGFLIQMSLILAIIAVVIIAFYLSINES